MDATSPAADQTTELLHNLSLDSQPKPQDITEDTSKVADERSAYSSVSGVADPNLGYMSNGYQAFYYGGGFNGSANGWEEYTRPANHDGAEVPHQGTYSDAYQHAYTYTPYGAYPSPGSSVAALGQENQLYGTQQYQYSGPFYQQQTQSTASYPHNHPPTSQGQVSTSVATHQPSLPQNINKESSNALGNVGVNRNSTSQSSNASQQNSSLTSNQSSGRGLLSGGRSSGNQLPRYGFDAAQSPLIWFDGSSGGQNRPWTASSFSSTAPNYSSIRNQNNHPAQFVLQTPRSSSGIGSATANFVNRGYPSSQTYSQYRNTYRAGYNYGTHGFNSRLQGQWGPMFEGKYKPFGRVSEWYGYGDENQYGHSELNRGPRAGRFKNPKTMESVTIAIKGQNLAPVGKDDSSAVAPDKDQFNRDDFPTEYADARFFIIKSYSEDDIHKSIKYNVWASTPNGNKKLDAAYRESQEKAGGCPVFLFFSVNTSGQFVGIAEMIGPVDFEKTVDYWQQDKWTGCFLVKWHIVKDVPNNMLKHIILENNDNKPVTNSRDTQEVRLEQGLQMIKIFKEHVSKTSILDDFGFYENREKIMLAKKAKQLQPTKQDSAGATGSDEKDKETATTGKPLESVSSLDKENPPVVEEQKPLE